MRLDIHNIGSDSVEMVGNWISRMLGNQFDPASMNCVVNALGHTYIHTYIHTFTQAIGSDLVVIGLGS